MKQLGAFLVPLEVKAINVVHHKITPSILLVVGGKTKDFGISFFLFFEKEATSFLLVLFFSKTEHKLAKKKQRIHVSWIN